MNAYVLLLILLAIYIVVLLYNKDIFYPSCIILESFIFSTLILCFNINKWNVNLSSSTIFIIIYGTLIFVITSVFVKKIKLKSYKNKEIKEDRLKNIKLPNINFNFLIIISILIFLLYIYYFYRAVGGFSNFSELSKAINYYRVADSYGVGEVASIPTIIVQLFKVLKIFSLICICVFINNQFYNRKNLKKVKGQFKYLLPMIMFLPITLLTGNRSELSTMLIAVVIIFNFTSIHYGYKLNVKKFLKYLFLVVFAIVIFSVTTTITGRTSKSTGFDYFSIYFGAPIQLLDMYVKNPIEKSPIIGKETFWGVNKFISNLKGEEGYPIHLESRSIENTNLGNVYTAYRNMYQDFGIIGLTILQVIISCIFTSMYYKIILWKRNDVLNISKLVYALIIHVLFFYSFSEQFYNTIISFNYVTLIIIIAILNIFLTKFRIVFRK